MRRAQRRKYHYFYKTTCKVTGKYYYGMHSTDNLDDGYIGSGKRLWYSINKHGKENHKLEILEFFDTREKLIQKEADFINENLLKDCMCMNLQLGGGGGFINNDHAKKFYSAGGRKVFQILNKRHREKLKTDKEYRLKFSKSLSERQIGEKNHFFGKHHNEKSKRQMGEKISIKQTGEKNSQYGTCWITNEKENKKIKKEDIIPDSWKLGRKMKT